MEILENGFKVSVISVFILQGGSNMTGTDLYKRTHNQSRSYLNHLVFKLHIGIRCVVITKVVLSTVYLE